MAAASVADPPAAEPPVAARPDRLPALDRVRGLVMAVMALDHTREYFTRVVGNPSDPIFTTPGLFFTRWASHFCAPAFFLLAGVGVALAGRKKGRRELARYLLVRGAFLVAVDLTVIRVGWDFNFRFEDGLWFIVLTTLGASMWGLAALLWLPRWLIAAFAVALIAGHNLLDGVAPASLGGWEPLWRLLHVRGEAVLAGVPMEVTYPLVPWVGVMALGYVLGPVFTLPDRDRRWTLTLLGLALTAGFVMLRATNSYGDPRGWVLAFDGPQSVFSFLRVEKYPPSLHYLLMTLGPILLLLAWLDRPGGGPVLRRLATLGRVPFFFYVAHLYLIHALAVAVGVWYGFDPRALCVVYTDLPEGWGFGLPVVYAVWLLVLAAMYPPSAWFADIKGRSRRGWVSYL